MSIPFWSTARVWLVVLLGAGSFLLWCDVGRIRRVEAVTNTDREGAVVDAASPTGYAGGQRWLIVPEHNNRSYQWIAETQQMLARGDWRVRRVDDENAPLGREVHAASPYRWWLGLVARGNPWLAGGPAGIAVEQAALYAEPLLHLLFLLATTLWVARYFGAAPAALVALGLTILYPLAGCFLPGVPDDRGLARACAMWSVLPLLAAVRGRGPGVAAAAAHQRTARLFAGAGVAGGLGLWISAGTQVPVLLGLALGGGLAAGIARGKASAAPVPWRLWGFAGATTCLVAYLAEYFPAHLDFRLQVNHPIYGLAWIGTAELLSQLQAWFRREKPFGNFARGLVVVLAAAAVAAVPVALRLSGTPSFLTGDPYAARLNFLPNGPVAEGFAGWVARDGVSAPVLAAVLPLLLLVPAAGLIARRPTDPARRAALALAFGPVAAGVALACYQLAWWSLLDAALLALLVVVAATETRGRWLWVGLAGVLFLPGGFLLAPPRPVGGNFEFTRLDAEALIERALAHWIADRAGPGQAVVLLPPDRTTSWCFHGGFRGIGTANWENRDGLAATVRIATATTAGEAQALMAGRGITHLILPSWDSDLDAFARWSLRNPEDAFIMALHHWALPPWLRPVPYQLPAVAGFEGQSVVVLEVTEENNRAAALGRLAEYFVEMQLPEQATAAAQSLQRFPNDLGAQVALAQVDKSIGDTPGFTQAFHGLLASLGSGFDRTLAWDRRVSLAVVLALGDRTDLARPQAERCFREITEARLRSLTTGSLYRLLVLGKTYGLGISDPRQRELAVRLLPSELRARL